MIDWEWIADQGDQIWERTIEHVTLTVIAVVVGLLVSALLALVALRNRRTYAPITWISACSTPSPASPSSSYWSPSPG